MKIHMFAALAAAASLAACVTTPDGKTHFDQVEGAVEAAIVAEIGTAGAIIKCPKGPAAELGLFTARRLFDSHYAGQLSAEQRKAVDDARSTHDKACPGTAAASPAAPAAAVG